MITVTSLEAQNKFGQLLDKAQREPVMITRHGRPAAFIVSPQDMDELINARRKRSKAVEEFEAFFAESDKHLKPAARKLREYELNAALAQSHADVAAWRYVEETAQEHMARLDALLAAPGDGATSARTSAVAKKAGRRPPGA